MSSRLERLDVAELGGAVGEVAGELEGELGRMARHVANLECLVELQAEEIERLQGLLDGRAPTWGEILERLEASGVRVELEPVESPEGGPFDEAIEALLSKNPGPWS